MSVLGNSQLLMTPEGYTISRSVRLRSSASAYFSRTPASGGTRTTWTWSAWVKRGTLGAYSTLFSVFDYAGGGSTNSQTVIRFSNTDNIEFYQFNTPSYNGQKVTSAVYRDPSAWYHIVAVWDTSNATASNRMRLYINGVQVTSFSTSSDPSLNANSEVNRAFQHTIGTFINPNYNSGSPTNLFDGYMTEVNFIDGQALAPSSFGETDAVTGVWKPKKYGGTYGTNGFYLNFSDNSAATAAAIGKDYSGNGNNWTPNNISVTSGVTYDSMIDVPTLYADGGTGRGNYCTLSPLQIGPYAALSAGNLRVTGNSATNSAVSLGTFSPTSGKWYWEVTQGSLASEFIGVMTKTVTGESLIDGSALAQTLGKGVVARYNGAVRGISGELQLTTTSTWTTGDIIQLAVDLDNGAVYFGKNGTWLNSGVPTSGSSKTGSFLNFTQDGTRCCTPACDAYNGGYVDANFGQRPFAYTPPTGFLALNTQNLTDSTIKAGNKYFDVKLRTGTGSAGSVTGIAFGPDFVWSKSRSAAQDHELYDAVRGATKYLLSDSITTEGTAANGLTAFNSDGYSFGNSSGSAINISGQSIVDWLWKKGATPGFDIVTYTGNYNGSTGTQTIAHSLNAVPKMIIIKNRSAAYDWAVGHASVGWSQAGNLNATNSFGSSSYFNSTAPTSSVFSVGLSNNTNQNLSTHVAYLFSEVAGFSKFGSYTGNDSADGPFVYCGFRPRWVMFKNTTNSGSWVIFDTSRDTYNVEQNYLFPNQSTAENGLGSVTAQVDYLSNGFKIRANNANAWMGNQSGSTFIFAAFAENPFKNALAR